MTRRPSRDLWWYKIQYYVILKSGKKSKNRITHYQARNSIEAESMFFANRSKRKYKVKFVSRMQTGPRRR